MWKKSKLNLFVLKSDHSRRNCDMATRRGRSAWAKNTVASERNNKTRKQSQLRRISARLLWLSSVCRIQVKCSDTLSVREVKVAADGTFLVLGDPARSSCVFLPRSSALLAVQWSAVTSLNRVSDVSFRPAATFLLHGYLSGTSLRSVMHQRGVPAGMLPLLSANVPQHLGCRPLRGERRQRKPESKTNKKKEYRKGKR